MAKPKGSLAKKRFVHFLASTLIPDLDDSGMNATADDFRQCVKLIRSGRSDRQFVEFLEKTLIPDLRASGRKYTAADFKRCVRYIKPKRK